MTCAAPDPEMIPFDLQSSRYKNQECSHCFFLFLSFLPPRSFFFSFPFPSLLCLWSLSGARNLPYFHSRTADFVRLVFKKNRLDIYPTEFNYVNMALVGRTPGNCLPSPPPPSSPPPPKLYNFDDNYRQQRANSAV